MRATRSAVAALGLVAGTAAAGTAQTWYTRSTCAPGALRVCAAVSAASVQVGSQWQIRLKVWNIFDGTLANGLSHSLTAVGLYAAGWTGSTSLASATFYTATSTFAADQWSGGAGDIFNWGGGGGLSAKLARELDASGGTDGINQALVGCAVIDGVPPRQPTCFPGTPYLELVFNMSDEFDLATQNWYFRYHSQEVAGGGCSVRMDEQFGAADDLTPEEEAACLGATSVPEPVTIALLGSGLLGLGGVTRRRRRGVGSPAN
jgi:hypothetical protein